MRIALLLLMASCLPAQESFPGAAAVDRQMERAVQDGLIPGGVVLIGHNGQVVYQRASGRLPRFPRRQPMTPDNFSDATSLTSVPPTFSSIMRHVERGQIRLNDPVTK